MYGKSQTRFSFSGLNALLQFPGLSLEKGPLVVIPVHSSHLLFQKQKPKHAGGNDWSNFLPRGPFMAVSHLEI